MSTSTTPSVNTLLQSAALPGGMLTQDAFQALQAVDYGNMIQNGIGISADAVTTSETILVGTVIDDSSSIDYMNNTDNVIKGHNMLLDALKGSKQSDGVLFYTMTLNNGIINPFNLLDQVVPLDNNNYNPRGSTPLYDRVAQALGTMVAKRQEFDDNAQPNRSIIVIVTDGADVGSREATPGSISTIVRDLYNTEMCIIIGIGISDAERDGNGNPIPGTGTDFKDVFRSMGIREKWILTPDNTESDIRRAFQVASQSVARASQGGQTGFSTVASGGFGI